MSLPSEPPAATVVVKEFPGNVPNLVFLFLVQLSGTMATAPLVLDVNSES